MEKDSVVESSVTHEIVRDCLEQYGRYVLSDRAVPSVLDGMKVGGRRTLWALWKLGALAKKIPIKSAQVVGKIIGEYHPHGDSAAYGALVHMVHLRHPLVHGDGNFGDPTTIPEDVFASARYTECKLTAFAERLFDDIDVVPMVPNFSETTEEPPLLPARLPMVLLNGTQGIAVGLSTSIPPHNLGEILDATLLVLRKPTSTLDDLLGVVKGPDYGYGTLTSRRQDLAELYDTGQGRLTFGSQYSIEDTDHRGVKKLVITGLAPEVKKNKLRDTVQDLHKRRLLESPLTDESTAKTGLRLTVEYRDAGILQARVLPLLESAVQYRWYCLDQDGTVRKFTLLQILQQFVQFRRDIETLVLKRRRKQLKHDLGVAEAKLAATQRLPEVVKILQAQQDEPEAKAALCRLLSIEEWQADVILGATVRSLARYGADAIKATVTKLRGNLATVQGQLQDIDGVVAMRLEEMRQYNTPRGTALRTRTKDLGDSAKQWCGVLPDGTVDVSIDLPTRSKAQWRYCGFFAADKFVVVKANNAAAVVAPMYLDRYQAGPTVGATAAQYCLVADQDGRYCCFETDQRRATFPVFRGQGKPLVVAGLNPGDRLLVVEQDGTVRWRDFTDIKVTRPNVQPHRLLRSGQILTVVQVPRDTTVMLTTGEELGSAEQIDPDAGILVVGPHNLVVQDNRRGTMSKKETIKAVQAGNVTAVMPLPEEPNAAA
jgi:DNA gyrase/topoisomerase IV subunit A